MEVPVGLVPAAEPELHTGGGNLERVVPPWGTEPAARLGALEGEGQRLLQPAGFLADPGQLEARPAEPIHIGLLVGDAAGLQQVGQSPLDLPERPGLAVE
jgi:hypothetical protein